MKTKLITFCCITALLCSAQTTDKKFMVKLYSGFQSAYSQEKQFNEPGNSYTFITNLKQVVLPIAPAFVWFNSKGNCHEIELANLEWKRGFSENKVEKVGGVTNILNGSNIYRNLYGLKYKYTQNIFRLKSWKIKPFIAYGALLQVAYDAVVPLTATSFVSEETHVDTYFQVEPGFEYTFYKNFNINLSLPLTIVNLDAERYTTDDSSLPENLESTEELSFNLFPKFYQFKLALGYKI
jgi:hypothetical protein